LRKRPPLKLWGIPSDKTSMKDSRNPTPPDLARAPLGAHARRPGLALAFFASSLVASLSSGCRTPPQATGLRFLEAKARHDSQYYSVLAVLENGSPSPLSLDELSIEMACFDAKGRLLPRGNPFSFRAEAVSAGAATRLPLYRSDRDRRIQSCRLHLKDERGRILAEVEVPPLEEEGGAAISPASGEAPSTGGGTQSEFKHLIPDR